MSIYSTNKQPYNIVTVVQMEFQVLWTLVHAYQQQYVHDLSYEELDMVKISVFPFSISRCGVYIYGSMVECLHYG